MKSESLPETDLIERAAALPRYLSAIFTERTLPAYIYRYRRPIVLITYALITAAAYFVAFMLRFEFAPPHSQWLIFTSTLPLLIGVRSFCYYAFGIARARLRFAGGTDFARLSAATVAGSVIFYLVSSVTGEARVPRSIIALEWGLTTYITATMLLLYRMTFEKLRFFRHAGGDRRTLIVGAGEAGSMLAREMGRFPTGFRVVGFLDDDPEKVGTTVQGLRVLAGTDRIADVARVMRAEDIVIATPSATPQNLRRIVERCEQTDLSFKVLPGIAEVVAGHVNPSQVRELRIEDLLGRDPITLELPELAVDLAGRSVLITGAAGSIGSELARQVAMHNPAVLVLLDQAETGLFYLELELREKFPDLQMVFRIADVVDEIAIERVFQAYTPSRVFHAAAYKHVPMMQTNVRQALRNNVIGTWRVAEAAGRYGSDKFILVSTDKAVEPTSIMGATKRLAEIVVIEMQNRFSETAYGAVRFGNVLASAGSVIPLFQQQIQQCKPLTITHPEVTRYFMTISEAVQLILQASLTPEARGQIAMLEMGEPIRIVDLARSILRLSGLPYKVGQTVVFSGLRPGEKLHEELFAFDEATAPTIIPKLKVVTPSKVTITDVEGCLAEWDEAFQNNRDADVLASLTSIFPSLHSRPSATRGPDEISVHRAAPRGSVSRDAAAPIVHG